MIFSDFLKYWKILGFFQLHCILGHAQLIQGFSDQTKVANAHFLVSVVELTPFLSISVCWFLFRLSQTKKRSPEEMGLLV